LKHETSKELPSWLLEKDPWKRYLSDNYFVFDLETTNLDYGFAGNPKNRLLLATGVGPDGEVWHHWGGEFEQEDLLDRISKADFIVCQNAKFELQWLERIGYPTHTLVVWDTMLGEYVRLGNRRGGKDLDSLCKRYKVPTKNPLVKKLMDAGVCPSTIPAKWLEEYGRGDSANTREVFLRQREELLKLKLLPVLFTRCLVTPVLAEIEMRGMHADKEAVEREYQATLQSYQEAEARVRALAGGINFNSPKQVGCFLYDTLLFPELQLRNGDPDRTDAGGRRTDEDAIKTLKATTEAQRTFKEAYLAAKPLVKKLDTLTKLRGCCAEDGGILYGNINQAVTQTHRTSSSGKKWKLQFQNFDRSLKQVFSARNPDWLVGEADSASLEFRGAGHLGKDPVIQADLRKGVDPHLFTATVIFKTVAEAVSAELRTQAKPFTFKPLYGGMSGTPDQVRYYRAFRQKYSTLFDAQTGWTYEVLTTGKLVTEWGLIFYWPNTTISKSGYISNTTSIFNYPVQSFCTAEIVPMALVFFWHRIKRMALRLFLVNTVHDSIIAEVPPDEVDVFRNIGNKALTEDVYNYLVNNYHIHLTVPLGVETKVGPYWSKGKAEKYEYDTDSN